MTSSGGSAESIGPGWKWRHLVVEQELGAGAFGVVWLARDALIGRPVALKVIQATDPDRADALLVEARALGQVQSPNVVVLYGAHRLDATTLLLEMEYVDGGTLGAVLGAEKRLPASQVVGLARGIAAGLAAVHVRRFVHGDVKPANVLLTRDGVPKLADFGLARLRDQPAGEAAAYGIAGTPQYMAPEVVLGEASTAASDIWSVGVILHRARVGARPFRGDGVAQLFHAVQNEEPQPSLGPEVPPPLARCVRRCLAKPPGERFPSASELADELRRIANPAIALPAAAPTEGLFGREPELARIDRAVSAAAAGVGDALLLLGPQGSGKSALLRAAGERARRDGFRVVDVAVTPLAGLVAPLLRAVRSARGDGPAPEVDPARGVDGDLGTALQGLAATGPFAVLVDGAEHVEPSEARALRDLARRLLPGPALLVVAARYGDGGPAGNAGTDP